MYNVVENVFFALLIVATFVGGVALFWIASQDESRMGRLLGIAFMAAALFEVGYVFR